MNNDRKLLMRRLQAADFALYETVLFLDGHPDNKKALEYYQRIKAERDRLMTEYAEKYGPLTPDRVGNQTRWDWVDSPWPWQRSKEDV
ncbi:MAG TPA: spore coat protein CotJB [Bacillota bacterium]|nr:spore coat protein CotJB [Bacillota bacterium]